MVQKHFMAPIINKKITNQFFLLCILNLPMMYLDGLISTLIGFQRFQTFYFLILFSLALVIICYNNISIYRWLLFPFFGLCFSIICSPLNINSFGGFTSNLQYFLRGPLLFIVLFSVLKGKISKEHIRLFCIVTILTCTISTIAHAVFSIGFVDKAGKLNPIYNGYLSDTNSAVFLLLLAALTYYHLLSGAMKKFLLIIILLFNVAALDSKAGILLIFLFLSVKFYFLLFRKTNTSIVVLCTLIVVSLVAIIFFTEQIAYYVLNLVYSISIKGQSSLEFRFETWDILTILTATRNLKYYALADAFPVLESANNFLFGNSFGIYQDNKLVESDLFDSLLALGFIGFISIYFLYLWPLYHRSKDIDIEFVVTLFVLILSVTVLVGHVFFSPASVVGISLIASYISKNSREKYT